MISYVRFVPAEACRYFPSRNGLLHYVVAQFRIGLFIRVYISIPSAAERHMQGNSDALGEWFICLFWQALSRQRNTANDGCLILLAGHFTIAPADLWHCIGKMLHIACDSVLKPTGS